MDRRTVRSLASVTVLAAVLLTPAFVSAAGGAEHLAQGHSEFTSVVTKKAGVLVVTTPNGAIHQLNENMARRHGQQPFKAEMKSSWYWMRTTTSSICISKARQANTTL